ACQDPFLTFFAVRLGLLPPLSAPSLKRLTTLPYLSGFVKPLFEFFQKSFWLIPLPSPVQAGRTMV
ncbi:hypothetical protein AALA61_12950, partial [Oscillospiraceae bacterium 42-9]